MFWIVALAVSCINTINVMNNFLQVTKFRSCLGYFEHLKGEKNYLSVTSKPTASATGKPTGD